MELRLQIKQWEREFEKSHGRKPQTEDIKADKSVYKLYKRYKKEKQAPAPASTPSPASPVSEEQAAPATPEPQPVEILPTPQLGGRTLGLFDLNLTPVKTPQRQQMEAATPKSRRTPSYLRQRDSPMKSPMRARRRFKSISELGSKFEDDTPTMSLDEIAKFSLVAEQTVASEMKPEENAAAPKKSKRKVVVRPVQDTDVPVSSKAGENYQRLTIQKRGFKGKRRG